MPRPFRVEIAKGRQEAAENPMSQHMDSIVRQLVAVRSETQSGAPSALDGSIAMWSGLGDIQKRMDLTKHEIGALQEKGVAGEDNARTTAELRAVVTGTEEATDTILSAAEAIDDVLAEHTGHEDPQVTKAINEARERVIEIFEACNFQDITGQRISKVVTLLQFVEERIASIVDVWDNLESKGVLPAAAMAQQAAPKPVEPVDDGKTDKLARGPSLAGDPDVVSQDDVDALFR
ncbi:MAG: protein phosphatase CheZ [Pseudomonadota bacterium]